MIPSNGLLILGLVSVSNAAVIKRTLAADDVVVLGIDGTTRVLKDSEFAALEARATLPGPLDSVNLTTTSNTIERRCHKTKEVQVLSDEEFLNWDVALSPVISSVGGTGSVTVSSGSSISNSISVGSSFSTSLDEIFGMSLSIEVSQSWSSSYEQSLSFEVPADHHGLIVSQPYVRRVQGNVWSGCPDSLEKTPFTSDSYTDRTYGTNLQWVAGLIRLCSSKTFPVPYCNGEGTHI